MRQKCKKALIVFIRRILPDGDIFGSESSDEFTIEIDGKTKGVFKRFENLSLPFTILGKRKLFDTLLKKAEEEGTTFRKELNENKDATTIVRTFFDRLQSSPTFSRQTLDHTLARIYVDDAILSGIDEGNRFEDHLAKIVLCWKQLSDFYCIEGLVGGDGERNPFRTNEKTSFLAGALDSLETTLPTLKKIIHSEQWKTVCLQISTVVGRSYKQIDQAVDILGKVFGEERELSEDEIIHSLQLITELSTSTFQTNTEIGKMYNTLIRFHNWMPITLKNNDIYGDTYDSICTPSKKALKQIEDHPEIERQLSNIKDATSPKGLALVTLVDTEKIGSKNALIKRTKDLEQTISEQIPKERKRFSTFELEDPTFYTGLTGGKWKGLKLLHDAKEAFGLSYQVPKGFAVSSLAFESVLKEKLKDSLTKDIFSIDDERRKEILEIIDTLDFEDCVDQDKVSILGNSLIARSSMYGEDGGSNFSGTYDSVPCERQNIGDAIKEVVKSYFSKEAIKSREDVGLSHVPGISVVIQQKIMGIGGVVHLTKEQCSVSFAETPEDAVTGNGTHTTTRTIDETVQGTPLEPLKRDFNILHKTFGDSDIEFVIDDESNVYFTQLRPKYKIPELVNINMNANRLQVNSLDDLSSITLDKKYIVTMNFLGKDNIMKREGEIMEFIRRNKQYIIAVEGTMPSVAHIPNKIEGHFRIPYIFGGTKK